MLNPWTSEPKSQYRGHFDIEDLTEARIYFHDSVCNLRNIWNCAHYAAAAVSAPAPAPLHHDDIYMIVN
jgi:hypothetical protein